MTRGHNALLSKASVTRKTFIAPKVFVFGNSDWICLKAHNLPFLHAKFHRTGSSGFASTQFWMKMWKTLWEDFLKIEKLTLLLKIIVISQRIKQKWPDWSWKKDISPSLCLSRENDQIIEIYEKNPVFLWFF